MVSAARGLLPTSSRASGTRLVARDVAPGCTPARSSSVAYTSITSTSACTTFPAGNTPGARMISGTCTSSW